MARAPEMTTVAVNGPEMLAGDRERVDSAYIEVETLSTEATRLERAAALLQAEADMARAEAMRGRANANRAQIRFQSVVSEYHDIVAREAVWMPPYRNSAGLIILQSPMTSRDQRVAAANLHKQMTAGSENLGGRYGGMFDEGEGPGQ